MFLMLSNEHGDKHSRVASGHAEVWPQGCASAAIDDGVNVSRAGDAYDWAGDANVRLGAISKLTMRQAWREAGGKGPLRGENQ